MGGIGGEALTHPALRGFHDRGAGHFGIVANPLGGRPRTFLNPVHQERGLVFHFGLKLGGILLEMSHPLRRTIGEVFCFWRCRGQPLEL